MKFVAIVLLSFLNIYLYGQQIIKVKLYETSRYSGVFCSLEQKMLKIKTGFVKNKSDFFQISVIDQNFNNVFNDIGKDYITICHKKQVELRVSEGVSNSILLEKNIIKTEYATYLITKIESDGSCLYVKECNECKEWTLKVVDRLPNIPFERIDGLSDNFSNYSKTKKYVFVEFWGTWCSGCIKILPEIKDIYDKHKDKLIVIYLNGREGKENANVVIKKYGIENWINGYSNEIIEKQFLQNGYPYGVLFDRNGKLIDLAVDPSKLKLFLDNIDLKNAK